MKGDDRINPWEKVHAARHEDRLKPLDYVNAIFKDVIELKGDRYFADDQSLRCGIGSFFARPVTYLAFAKGHDLDSNIRGNFGMVNPEGYRKAVRLMKQAEKFNRPVITFVDTPGANPGIEAEERGQGEAIAECIMVMQTLEVPTLVVVTGEGGSGGALALSMGDRILMLEHAVYSIISPEGFSSIIFKDNSKAEESSELMKLTAQDLYEYNIVDEIIKEDGLSDKDLINSLASVMKKHFDEIVNTNTNRLVKHRMKKFRNIGR